MALERDLVDLLRTDRHVGLVVDSDHEFDELVRPLFDAGAREGEKLVVFGSGCEFDAGEISLNERWSRNGVAAELLAFELALDRTVHALGATMLCSYRRHMFTAVAAAMSAHSHGYGRHCTDLGFRMWSGDGGRWHVRGAIDLTNVANFRAALHSAAGEATTLRLCFADPRFLDLAGLQALADTVDALSGMSLQVESSPHSFRRCWQMLGYDETRSRVEIPCAPLWTRRATSCSPT